MINPACQDMQTRYTQLIGLSKTRGTAAHRAEALNMANKLRPQLDACLQQDASNNAPVQSQPQSFVNWKLLIGGALVIGIGIFLYKKYAKKTGE